MSVYLRNLFMALLCLLTAGSAFSQNRIDPLLFSNQAVQFGDQRELVNPISGIMPGTAYASGFGAFLDNPASIALFKDSFGEFGLTFSSVDEEASFLNQSRSLDDAATNISNVGFIYSFPTVRGSLVIGAGYNQHSSGNRALGFGARNTRSTITDQFKAPGNTFSEIAFRTFATDFGDDFEDWDESIFRTGFDQFGDFLGIRQQGEIIESGHGGEYSAFIATEFQPNFMLGASIGLLAGRFDYDRIFQEIDEFNDYNFQAIDSDEDGEPDTDIDNIIFSDEISSRYSGFRGRIGGLYRVTPNVNIGASYTLPSVISVDEDFGASIQTTFDNGVVFEDALEGQFSYTVRYPGNVNVGIALQDLDGFSISFAADYTDYSNVELEFDEDELFEDELAENQFISNEFDAVWNVKGGLSYKVNPGFTVRAGYGRQPSRFKNGIDDRDLYSAGAGFAITPNTTFEVGALYIQWDEDSAVYTYTEYDYTPLPDAPPAVAGVRSEDASRSVDFLQLMGTIKFNFNN
ncbi:MAG: hypothetical protein GVY08_04230 [Bacteroidetes bacterium]|jgi:hypothetical protein|nr:hypothetical protein [Bacteroidota bacterium]